MSLQTFFGTLSSRFGNKFTDAFLSNGKIISEGSIFLTSLIVNGISSIWFQYMPSSQQATQSAKKDK
jgi:hypothetical protein